MIVFGAGDRGEPASGRLGITIGYEDRYADLAARPPAICDRGSH